jgi:spore coat polysaccharide biosynthesis protein SpsF
LTRIGIVTQARMSSSRLPGKVLLRAGGESMLAHHITRLNASHLPVIVATSVNEIDDAVVGEARAYGAHVFRGSEEDVLGRFAGAARQHRLDVVVRVTADCPLIDADVILTGIKRFVDLSDDGAHVSNVLERTYPRGFDFEVFSASALLHADAHATSLSDREHVTPYLYRNGSGLSSLHSIRRPADASAFRVTLDTTDDLRLLTRLIDEHHAESLSAEQIIELLIADPELAAINSHIEQKRI